ncbi:MAG: hypothetical protein UX75_C0019G0013 [Candidatus Moranbacteria bacterium GW2011_GWE2_47_10]|nr:MAG: hypothetical protein UX75_C0019G0013 [Candidatus Moranbacteria bacterium GW2011_GWE2_47_10]
MGEPKMPTPEEMAKIQKERALSDAELIKGGAEYVADENGLRLEVTREQANQIEDEEIFDRLNEQQKLGIETIHYLNELEDVIAAKFNNKEMRVIKEHLGLIQHCIINLSEKESDDVHVPPALMADGLKNSERLKNGDNLLKQIERINDTKN